MAARGGSSRMPPRSHSNFAARAAQDDDHRLESENEPLLRPRPPDATASRDAAHGTAGRAPSKRHGRTGIERASSRARGPPSSSSKLGTFAGVFVPTTLNILSILMFLRFGFILGQSGVVGMMGMLIACYAINLLTTMSISAIATNGTVRGGGAYYLISRSLGPEFGGSIGIVFYLGFVFNTGMNAVGLITCFIESFGSKSGNWSHWMPEGFWWEYLWATVVLVVCTAICLAGSGLFARCSNGLLAILLVATFSIPFSALIQQPFENRKAGVQYTGLNLETLKGNLMPHLTRGAAGSQVKGRETWQDLFGILFPATGGIFAGASMSGDLKHPSKAIPKGTLCGLALTFVIYTIVILSMAASVTRVSFYRNANVIQLVNVSDVVVLLGEFASSFFSTLMGVIGSAKLLQALARDNLIPGLSIFGQGTKGADEPVFAIIITYILSQLTMLADINQIASFVTMTYLMTFLVTNLACFLLKIASAPNFRPSFHYFNWWTAAIGTVVSGITMFFVDGLYASGCVAILLLVFLIIHYTTLPKPWGDVSQSLIYHQVRKYLLRLRQEHVKFWRPQILLFINDPRRQYKLIQFCNSLKKGGLFILGHVIVTNDFAGAVPEAKHQQTAWTKYIDFSMIKAFINVVISPGIEWGTRNVVLSAGLGGMKPNIVVMGFYNLNDLRTNPLDHVPSPQPCLPSVSTETPTVNEQRPRVKKKQTQEDRLKGKLPTDAIRKESAVNPQSYVTILEDLLLRLKVNVALAKGFQGLEFPASTSSKMERVLSAMHIQASDGERNTKKYIDLWPIQMAAEITAAGPQKGIVTTNFDTYTLILQLGCILNTVPSWKRAYRLRVAVFVEYESDVEEERGRVTTLLNNLRIEAEVLVFWLASGDLKTYEIIINAKSDERNRDAGKDIEEALKDETWWQDIENLRGRGNATTPMEEAAQLEALLENANNWPGTSFQQGDRQSKPKRFAGLRKMLRKTRRRTSMSSLSQFGINMGMRTHRLPPDFASGHCSASESSSDDEGDSEADDNSEDMLSVASENDVDEYDLDGSEAEPSAPVRRTQSADESVGRSITSRKPAPRNITDAPALELGPPPPPPSNTKSNPLERQADATSSDSTLVSSQLQTNNAHSTLSGSKSDLTVPRSSLPNDPRSMRQHYLPKPTSRPVPRAHVTTDDGPSPSIMFTDPPPPEEQRQQRIISSIYSRGSSPHINSVHPASSNPNGPGTSSPSLNHHYYPGQQPTATGSPAAQAVPLSFNDLPCRAQHLVLNELIKRESGDTAVVFTTLPSPMEGTCETERDSVRYLRDLEVLCQGLPPVLLVHSNSMTVTMNL